MTKQYKKIPKLSIGIPAYNESKNIICLLDDLIKQKAMTYSLEKIIIVSDGSTDDTPSLIKKYANKKINLIDRKVQKGLAYSLNEIITNTSSDILVILNADIRIPSSHFIENLINAIQKGHDLVSARIMPYPPTHTVIEKILYNSMQYKNDIFDNMYNGRNVYTCHGPARAFSKKLYSHIKFPTSVGEDMYSYLYAKKYGYSYFYAKDALVNYQLPTSLSDHGNQSIRFFSAKKLMVKELGEAFVITELHISIFTYINKFIKHIRNHPIELISYTILSLYMVIKARYAHISRINWSPAASSKGRVA